MQGIQPSTLCHTPHFQHHHNGGPLRLPSKRAAAFRVMASAPKRETDPKKRVVITGMGLVSVFGNNPDTFYERLPAGESGISPIDRFDASKFPTRFGGQIRGFSTAGYIDGKNDPRLDDCLRYCIVAGKRAIEDAAHPLDSLTLQAGSNEHRLILEVKIF